MKKLLFIFLLLPGIIQAQQWQRQYLHKPLYNSISVSVEPTGGGKLKYTKMGLRYDRIFTKLGVYTSGSYGSYEFVRNSAKFAVGGIYVEKSNFVTLGAVYHINRGIIENIDFDKRALQKYSFEVGAGRLFNRFVISFNYELILGSAAINFGIRF